MVMTYDGALVMPSSYAVMEEQEMTYVEGGSYPVAMTKALDNKAYCLHLAQAIYGARVVKGMSALEMAKELYAHAVCVYHYFKVSTVLGPLLAGYCYSSGKDGVALMDGGDSAVRKIFYNSVWQVF